MLYKREYLGASKPESAGMMRWLMTYADMITLLMIFFIIMYSLVAMKSQQLEKVVNNLTGGTSSTNYSYNNIDINKLDSLLEQQAKEERLLENIVKQLNQYVKEHNLQNVVSVTLEDRGVVVSFKDVALFQSGSDVLSDNAKDLINAMCIPLEKINNQIRVEGYTDDEPINNSQFKSNWELSSARADSVLEQIIASTLISPDRLATVGYGQYRPVLPNTTTSGRQANRRVDLVVLRSIFNNIDSN